MNMMPEKQRGTGITTCMLIILSVVLVLTNLGWWARHDKLVNELESRRVMTDSMVHDLARYEKETYALNRRIDSYNMREHLDRCVALVKGDPSSVLTYDTPGVAAMLTCLGKLPTPTALAQAP